MASEEDGSHLIPVSELQNSSPDQQQATLNKYLLLQYLQNQLPLYDALIPQPRALCNPHFPTESPDSGSSMISRPLNTPQPIVQMGPNGVLEQVTWPPNQSNCPSAHDQPVNIPEEQNTSVWITNLPPTCTYAELLLSVRHAGHTGKIFATVIHPPRGNHATSAAKIVFFDVEGKTRLLSYAASGAFSVSGFLPNVIPNRNRTAARLPSPESRVLFISGPAEVVNWDFLCAEFQKLCSFDLEYIRQRVDNSTGRVTMEWAFASYRRQAERVYEAVRHARYMEIRWGQDPCDLLGAQGLLSGV
ncbi:hypothetical protein F5B22DRAFT_658138 [Xylaria bambusicola]|uniref:uncharacterized protein n=1 Tax=Xylaria bambusicola TaxID=326684 RepID=UPI0020087959|nr:uncharacterized protein F5B22DRAFT_658138 [Xylaria bambusicola]KAI0509386.1 hypothetical protein F5B22DRAFT_658138 [Xylaria bambusicola]